MWILAIGPSSTNYSMINPGVGTTKTRISLMAAMKPCRQLEGQRELQRNNNKGLGLHRLYISNTWPGDDHVPSIIQTMHGSRFYSLPPINNSNYLHNEFNKQCMNYDICSYIYPNVIITHVYHNVVSVDLALGKTMIFRTLT